MKRKVSMFIALLLVMTVMLAAYGCGSQSSDGSQSSAKGTLIVASAQDAGTSDPYGSTAPSMWTWRLYINNLESLFMVNEKGETVPYFVKDYKMDPDNMGVTITIPKATFHNGDPVKASDILYSLKRYRNGARGAYVTYLDLENSKAIDDYTVNIRTKEVTSQLLMGLTDCWVVSEKDMESRGNMVAQSMVGTGRFYVDKYVSGDSVTFKRYDEYWGEKAALETIIVRFISEPAVQLMELETGGIDIALDTLGKDVKKIIDDKDTRYAILSSKGDSNNYLGFNNSKPPFDDIRMRQAVAHAIDRQAIVDATYMGLGKVGTSMVPDGYFGHVDNEYPEYNPEKAKALIKEAGYENGLEIKIINDENSFRKGTIEQLINMLGAVGIKLTASYHDFPTWSELLIKGNDYNIYVRGMGGASGECYGPMTTITKASAATNPMKTKGIKEAEEYDKILDAISKELDTEKRRALYGDAQRLYAKELFGLPIHLFSNTIIVNSKLKGVYITGGLIRYYEAHFEE